MFAAAFGAALAQGPVNTCPMYDCSQQRPAQHIKDLHPCDVEVVMALGDSITAAAVPFPLEYGINEWRGYSFSAGGAPGAFTLPNLIANLTNRKPVVGPSLSYHFPEFPGAGRYADDHGNAAQSGAHISDLSLRSGVGNQTGYLLDWAAGAGVTDEQWKVVTILIGANDMCRSCSDAGFKPTPAEFATEFDGIIQVLRNGFKRVLINAVSMFRISPVFTVASGSTYCSALHDVVIECGCLWHDGDVGRARMDNATAAFNAAVESVVTKWASAKFDDFALVLQPYMEGFVVPEISWLSPIDCFHPSDLAHSYMAMGLWNIMQTPIATKTHNMDFHTPLMCANATTRFYSS